MLARAAVPALVLALFTGGFSVASSEEPVERTYYFHASFPVNEVEEFSERQAQGPGPKMDERAPTDLQPKAASQVLGNPDIRKNAFNSYWAGSVHGTVSDLEARIWLTVHVPSTLNVDLFGDGGLDATPSFAHAEVPVHPGMTLPLVIDFGPATASIDEEIVLGIQTQTGVTTLFDSVMTPSSLSFRLGPYVPPQPPAPKTPAAGWGEVVTVSRENAYRETSLVIDPTNDDVMLACSPSGIPAYRTGQSFFFVTRDQGRTWSDLDVETEATDGRQAAMEGGDCDVAFDAGGTMYVADTWLGSLSMGASRDGGATWRGTPVAASAPVVDRPWLVGGKAGTVHVTYQDLQLGMPTLIWYTRSTDHGGSYLPAIPIATSTTSGAFTWQGNFVVSPDEQHLYSVHTRRTFPNRNLEQNGPESVWVSASHDGGITWSERLVAPMPNPASFLYPAIAMDKGGILHVVFASRTATDHPVWYSASRDGATTWSAPVKVREGVGAWAPWIDGGEAGEAVIQWLGTPTWRFDITSVPADWYLSWARVTGTDAGAPTIVSGTTTTTPLFRGNHTQTPEFNTVRRAPDGSMRIAASVYQTSAGGATGWDILYQETG